MLDLANLAGSLNNGSIKALLDEANQNLKYDWSKNARPNQLPPSGNYRFLVIMAGRGFGKALSLDTPIPTVSGWKTMGEIQVGDRIFDESGNPCNVTFATETMFDRPCFDVVFDGGEVIKADTDHRWLTWTHAARKANSRRVGGAKGKVRRPECEPSVKTTAEISSTILYGGRESNHSIDMCPGIQLEESDLPIHPYVLGVWLGDGDSKSSTITSADPQIVEEVRSCGYSVSSGIADPRSRAVRYSVGV